LLTNGRYGFHRDELQFMSDARHLDWGFVAYPPVAPLLARISMTLFGLSLSGLRLFPLFAQTAALFVTALMTKELGGDRLASAAAVLGVGLAVYPFYAGTVFQYTAFDYLWWVLSEYFAVRLLTSGNPRWWPAIGASAGFGLLTKYTIAFLIAGLLCGLILTDARRYLRNGWFWCGSAIAILICLPNIYWQLRHSFVSYDFLQFIHARDISNGVTDNFLIDQPILCMNAVAAPLCLAGLVGCWRNPRYRLLAWMYIVPFGLFFIMKARSYYLAPIYPMLMAMGAVMAARWVSSPGAPLKKVAARREKGAAATEYFNPRARASHPTGNGLRGFSLPPWSFGEPGSV
jgi:4-amino-4-deoxy-L-arabinose transferase-like glycosyltransferase